MPERHGTDPRDPAPPGQGLFRLDRRQQLRSIAEEQARRHLIEQAGPGESLVAGPTRQLLHLRSEVRQLLELVRRQAEGARLECHRPSRSSSTSSAIQEASSTSASMCSMLPPDQLLDEPRAHPGLKLPARSVPTAAIAPNASSNRPVAVSSTRPIWTTAKPSPYARAARARSSAEPTARASSAPRSAVCGVRTMSPEKAWARARRMVSSHRSRDRARSPSRAPGWLSRRPATPPRKPGARRPTPPRASRWRRRGRGRPPAAIDRSGSRSRRGARRGRCRVPFEDLPGAAVQPPCGASWKPLRGESPGSTRGRTHKWALALGSRR